MGQVTFIACEVSVEFDVEEVDSAKGQLRWEEQEVFIAIERKAFEVRLRARSHNVDEPSRRDVHV